MSLGRRSVAPRAIVLAALSLVMVVSAFVVVRTTQDDPSAANGLSGPRVPPRPTLQDSGVIGWSAIETRREGEPDPDWPEGRLGVPALTYDPVVGTVALWPNGHDVEVSIKAPGEGWGKPHVISGGGKAEFLEAPLVGTDGAGTVTAAWVRTLSNGDENGPWQSDLVTATRAPDGDWTEPTVLWEAPWLENLEATPMGEPHLAVGPDGSAAMAWTEDSLADPSDEESGFTQAHAVYRAADGEWQREVILGQGRRDPHGFGNQADGVGINGRGLATVVVTDAKGMRAYRSDGRNWKAGELIAHGSATDMEVAPGGTTSMVFIEYHGNWNEVRGTTLEEGAWTAPVRLAPRRPPRSKQDFIYYNNPQLAVHSGTATVVFTPWRGPVQALTRSPGGEYTAPQAIAKAGRDLAPLDMLGLWVNKTGQALAIWGPSGQDDGFWVPQGSYRESAEGPWRTPVPLSDGKSATGDLITQYSGVTAIVYPSGAALVLWSDGDQMLSRTLGVTE